MGPISPRRCSLLLVASTTLLACDDPVRPAADIEAAAVVAPSACFSANRKVEDLLNCITLDNVRAHQAALQVIADANGDNRVTGSAGHEASVQYVVSKLTESGYDVSVQAVPLSGFFDLGGSALEQQSPVSIAYVQHTDFNVMAYSAAADVAAAVNPVDLFSSSSGCEPADFAGFPPFTIALIERGACTFQVKAENAANAGAVGVIIFNNVGNTALINGTLTQAYVGGIPVVATTRNLGIELAATPGLTMRLYTNVQIGPITTYNVLAESGEGDPGNVVMVGGHLDSVTGSPGINDNGSGVAAVLETAIQMAGAKTKNRVRFAFWGGHEQGLVGSTHYLNNLSQAGLDAIALYIDVETIGSPNYVRFVLDGDGSVAAAGPAGSGAIESFFADFYTSRGLAFDALPLGFNSDYGPFAASGIPIGGVHSGSALTKTAQQESVYGGTAGDQHDPCYHLACDTFANVSMAVLDLNADEVAAAVMSFGMSSVTVNGVKGKGRFKPGKVETTSAAAIM